MLILFIHVYLFIFFFLAEYEHPVEAVQSISMLHNQTYYDRKMSVRMDRVSEKQESTSSKLPPGLKGIGMGLGVNGSALIDVNGKFYISLYLYFSVCIMHTH